MSMNDMRTTLWLSTELAERIAALSRRSGVNQSELIRRCLSTALPEIENQYKAVVEPKEVR